MSEAPVFATAFLTNTGDLWKQTGMPKFTCAIGMRPMNQAAIDILNEQEIKDPGGLKLRSTDGNVYAITAVFEDEETGRLEYWKKNKGNPKTRDLI